MPESLESECGKHGRLPASGRTPDGKPKCPLCEAIGLDNQLLKPSLELTEETIPDSSLSPRDREIFRRLQEVTPNDFERILRKVAEYNPYAAQLIAIADSKCREV